MRNQKASLQIIENQVGQIAQLLSERPQGNLPSNTVPNPNAHVMAITLRNGKTTEKESEPISQPIIEKEEIPVEMHKKQVPASKRRPKELTMTYVPPISYPGRLKMDRMETQYGKFLGLVEQLHVNLPFVEAFAENDKLKKEVEEVVLKKQDDEANKKEEMNCTLCASKLPIQKVTPEEESSYFTNMDQVEVITTNPKKLVVTLQPLLDSSNKEQIQENLASWLEESVSEEHKVKDELVEILDMEAQEGWSDPTGIPTTPESTAQIPPPVHVIPSWEDEFGDELLGVPLVEVNGEQFDLIGDLDDLEALLFGKPTMVVKKELHQGMELQVDGFTNKQITKAMGIDHKCSHDIAGSCGHQSHFGPPMFRGVLVSFPPFTLHNCLLLFTLRAITHWQTKQERNGDRRNKNHLFVELKKKEHHEKKKKKDMKDAEIVEVGLMKKNVVKSQTTSEHEYTELIKWGAIRLKAERSLRKDSFVYLKVNEEERFLEMRFSLDNLTLNESSD
ncbi:hypothetical protein L1987_18443 [Smallanthus sonchifolius]|uniref:Uncharacterized protein n=1 Tax=Smallanthus sonchifolius TaxID=185202 RepID=A0ACB9J035_9ASTR|nr:hypothetical protein L1987_18443 [Smallanthus sonchifolius]